MQANLPSGGYTDPLTCEEEENRIALGGSHRKKVLPEQKIKEYELVDSKFIFR